MPVEDLTQSQMMNHMLEALENGEDIGHYGRLTFAMVGVYFANDDELVQVMTKNEDADEREVRAMVQQVREKGYNPPNRDKILEWQSKQDFQICPNPDDPDACNVYSELDMPQEVLEDIQEYRAEEQAARES
jgi:DNA primase large subunit